MSILVTGGAGYIGSHTCIELLNAGYEIVIVDNFYNSKRESLRRIAELSGKEFAFYECDIRDKEGLDKIFKAEKIDALLEKDKRRRELLVETEGLKQKRNEVSAEIANAKRNKQDATDAIKEMREVGAKIKSLDDVKEWYNPRLEKNPYAWDGKCMHKHMMMLIKKYPYIRFRFCDKKNTGKEIIKLLSQERK